jgi:hypothetical protein
MAGNKNRKIKRKLIKEKIPKCGSKSGVSREQKWRIENKKYPPVTPPQLPTMADLLNEMKEVTLQSKSLNKQFQDQHIDLMTHLNPNINAQNIAAYNHKCPHCSSVFTTQRGLNIHIGRMHRFL